jgi:outer membrane protein assembly factor BamB
MSEDFMSRLQLQLRDAAERESRRGAPGRAARDLIRSPVLAGAAAAVVLLLAVGTGALLLRDEEPPAGPRVVDRLALTGNPAQLVPAFGAVWIADAVAGEVVRVDARERAVAARIPVGPAQRIVMQPVGDRLWVLGERPDRVLQIDPATNRVAGRIALRAPGGRTFPAVELLANDRDVWAVSGEGALRLDPRTGAGRVLVARPTARNEARWITLGGDTLWVYGTDGAIRRFDASDGAARGRFVPQMAEAQWFWDIGGDLLGVTGAGRVARVDGRTGAVRWERAVAERIHADTYGGGLIWIYGTRAGAPSRLVALDPRDGETVSSTALPGFGAAGAAVIGDEVWVDDTGGRTIVVRR